MTRRTFAQTVLAALPASRLGAAPSWEQQPPEEWSDEHLDELLVDSPWAKSANVLFTGGSGGGGSFPGSGGGRGRTGIPGGGWPGRFAFDADEAPVVRWESALPIRHALAARRNEPALTEHDPSHYEVVLTGLPFGAAPMAERPQRILAGCALARKGRAQIRPERLEILPRPGAPGVRFLFPRDKQVDLEDRSVEFLLSLDDYQVTRKFKLKEMVYRGRLEL